MKNSLLIILSLIFFTAIFSVSAIAEDNSSDLVQTEVDKLKIMLPIEDEIINFYDVKYEKNKGLVYFYTLKKVGTAEREIVIKNLETLEENSFIELCKNLPEYFLNALASSNTPIIYRYYDNTKSLLSDIRYDLKKCPKMQ